ncbi:MAG: pantoate--beta-alanine ligase [Actinobacteria bacterium]|nr:pantoate--beta-alanine ligase [Actinomycetota bacterium]
MSSNENAVTRLDLRSRLLVSTAGELRRRVDEARIRPGAVIGLVPTMGFFHEGHLSLMRAARAECSYVIVSAFVNPIQFGATEDFNTYPRDLDRDLAVAAGEGVDLMFAPPEHEVYQPGFDTMVVPGKISEGLCGASRPGHFRGVATIVAKLFNIVKPDTAYFGQKDAQQVAVIRRMATDLNFDVAIRVCPTVREPGGLAMSSRNTYLSDEEREQAAVLFRALSAAKEAAASGETSVSRIRRKMKKMIGGEYLVDLEYVKIVNPVDLEPVEEVATEALVAVAARVGRTRLIDNMMLTPGGPDAADA